mgnify:CR=1 FL=1
MITEEHLHEIELQLNRDDLSQREREIFEELIDEIKMRIEKEKCRKKYRLTREIWQKHHQDID